MSIDLQFLEDCLIKLNKIIRRIVDDASISNLVGTLEDIIAVFQEIRRILGQSDKMGKIRREETTSLITSLQSEVYLADVYKTVERRFRMYENELYNCYDNKYMPQTNNALKNFNNHLKCPIQKGQGKKQSWFYMEHQGESTAYYHNLLNAPHMVGSAEIS